MADLLEVESQLEAAAADTSLIAPSLFAPASEAGYGETASAQEDDFYSSKKSSTWKKLKKIIKTSHNHVGEESPSEANAASHHPTQDIRPAGRPATSSGSMNGQQAAADDASEVASETGRSSRTAYWYELARPADGAEGGKSTLKGVFKKNKKGKQIELDALRFEMGMLQERHDLTERDLATYRHDVGTLRQERDHLANQVQELTAALNITRSERDIAASEGDRLKELHAQVKAALQESYSREKGSMKQVKELEELCGAQQNSLEEAEERYRMIQQEHDELHHAALAAKAQLVTAQAQLVEARTQREELLADLTSLTSQATALQSEIDSRDEKMGDLEMAAEQANAGLEAALGRLRELEAEKQQLEARVTLLQEENLELSTEVSGVVELRRQLETQLKAANAASLSYQAQLERANASVATLTARLEELSSQLASSHELGGSLHLENSELLAELSRLREQRGHKQGSPLSKWRKGPAQGGTNAGCKATSSNPTSSTAPAAGSTSEADAAGFSPMTSHVLAVRAPATAASQQQWPDDDTNTAVMPPDSTAIVQADSSCTVTAALAAGSTEPVVGTEAALAPSSDKAVPAGSGELQTLHACSTMAIPEFSKGPLTAARPTSRRQTGKGSKLTQPPPPAAAATELPVKALPKSPRKLLSGVQIPDEQQSPQRHQDWVARFFTCLAPQTTELQPHEHG